MIISYYCPNNVNDQTDITIYDELSSLARHIPKHNVTLIGGDMFD